MRRNAELGQRIDQPVLKRMDEAADVAAAPAIIEPVVTFLRMSRIEKVSLDR